MTNLDCLALVLIIDFYPKVAILLLILWKVCFSKVWMSFLSSLLYCINSPLDSVTMLPYYYQCIWNTSVVGVHKHCVEDLAHKTKPVARKE